MCQFEVFRDPLLSAIRFSGLNIYMKLLGGRKLVSLSSSP